MKKRKMNHIRKERLPGIEEAGGRQDYDTYRPAPREWILWIGQGVCLSAAAVYLFYESAWALPFFAWVPWLYTRQQRRQRIAGRKKELNYQFKDALSSMSVALQAGYSAENAVMSCAREMERLYGKEADITREFCWMEKQLRLSVPVETLLLDFGNRSHVEDIRDFAAVFYTARHTGGDLARILRKTGEMLGDKIDVSREIEAVLAARRSEQRVMSLMPAGIIAYLKLTSPGFLGIMYKNPVGIAAMTAALFVYAFAWWLGRHIVEIEV